MPMTIELAFALGTSHPKNFRQGAFPPDCAEKPVPKLRSFGSVQDRLDSAGTKNFNHCGLTPCRLLPKELLPDLLEFVIPECFYPSISLGTVRLSNRRNPGETGTGPPIKTFGGDAFGINSHRNVLISPSTCCGVVVSINVIPVRPELRRRVNGFFSVIFSWRQTFGTRSRTARGMKSSSRVFSIAVFGTATRAS
jgi:hypothetical protein